MTDRQAQLVHYNRAKGPVSEGMIAISIPRGLGLKTARKIQDHYNEGLHTD